MIDKERSWATAEEQGTEVKVNVVRARNAAVANALDALARYKFWMFGYWAARFVAMNQTLPDAMQDPNPFKFLVHAARERGYGPQKKERKT